MTSSFSFAPCPVMAPTRGSWRENKRGTSTAKIVPLAPDVVVTKLVAEGSVGDYDLAAQTAIKTVLAAEADVSPAAVSLTLTAGSVIVTADIFFNTQAGATLVASQLSAGVLADAATFQATLNSEFAAMGLSLTVAVHAILDAPTVVIAPLRSHSRRLGPAVQHPPTDQYP